MFFAVLAPTASTYPVRAKPPGYIDNHLHIFRVHTNAVRVAKCLSRIPIGLAASELPRAGSPYRRVIRITWKGHHQRATNAVSRCLRTPQDAIRHVFGSRSGEALTVAWCESRYDVNAVNGQYLGLFQMGSWERATYGHGTTALAQSRAAHSYFVASGRDWSPWECKP